MPDLLFDEIQRSYTGAAEMGEPIFKILNRSARPDAVRIRALLEDWYAALPVEAQRDVRSRFRSADASFHSAFFELYLHSLHTRLGFDLETHPQLPDTNTHPDYLVSRTGLPAFYLEAIVPTRKTAELSKCARRDQVYALLNRIQSPNFFLAINDVTGAPSTSPNTRALRKKLEQWLGELDPDAVISEYEVARVLPSFWWDLDGWNVQIKAIPKKVEARGKTGGRPVGAVVAQAEWSNTEGRLRSAIKQKASKYGRFNIPYVIAVNLVDQSDYVGPGDWIDLLNALLGDEEINHTMMADGSVRQASGRSGNGIWWGPEGARNTHISGLLLTCHLYPHSIARRPPMLIHHPAADQPIPTDLWSLGQATLDLTRLWDELQIQSSLTIPFDLPPEWPNDAA